MRASQGAGVPGRRRIRDGCRLEAGLLRSLPASGAVASVPVPVRGCGVQVSAVQESSATSITALRLRLLENGYRPVPVSGPQMRCPEAGKAPLMRGWLQICAAADEAEVRRWAASPEWNNTGLLCGDLV